mgnify:CR=1 FL=1
MVASGFTSTAFDPKTKNSERELKEDEIWKEIYDYVKSKSLKGMVELKTNIGNLII